jgi:hypothetical protein
MSANSEVELTSTYCGYLLNLLNEVVHGLPVDFEADLKVEKEEAVRLFQKLDNCSTAENKTERLLSTADARLLLNCANRCLREFDESEFETRLGVSLADARHVGSLLSEIVGAQ